MAGVFPGVELRLRQAGRPPSDIPQPSGAVWSSETTAKLKEGVGTRHGYSKLQRGGDHLESERRQR